MRMTVADIMSQCFVKISPECSADEALGLLHRYEETELYVTDKQGRLLGILPDYEIIKTQLSGESRDATVGQLMSRGVPVFQPDSDASEVARQLRDARHATGRLQKRFPANRVFAGKCPPSLQRALRRKERCRSDRPAPLPVAAT